MRTANHLLPRLLLFVTLLGRGLELFARQPRLVSAINPAQAPVGANGDSVAPISSPDGRFIVFASSANNLLVVSTNQGVPARVRTPLKRLLA
jgi:hypothetical protein